MALLLPSCYRFYNFKSATIKPFKVFHLVQFVTTLANNNLKLMFSTFDDVFSEKSGILTLGDLEFLIYYQWFNTFNRPFTFEWTSKYGDLCTDTVTFEEFKITKMEATDFSTKFKLPQAEEMLLLKDSLKPELKWVYDRIQYMVEPTIAERVSSFNYQDPKLLDEIKVFVQQTYHGLDKTVKRKNSKFDCEAYLYRLYEDRNRLKFHLQHVNDLAFYSEIADRLYKLEQEVDALEKFTHRKLGSITKKFPELEPVTVEIDLNSFVA